MIIQHTADGSQVLFIPEDNKERKTMNAFPGMLRHGLSFYAPNKPHIIYNLYQRLSRKLKNIKYTPAIKQLIDGDIEIKQIPDWFKFHTIPLKHQTIALRFAYTFGNFLNLSEPGLGKTKVTLDYIWLMQFTKSVIICPKALRFVWEEERKIHRPELKVYVVETTDWEEELPHIKEADVVVINYDKAVALTEPLKRLQIDFIAVDEGLIKDPSTDRTKAITALSRGIPHRSIMSGTLVNNSPLDVFSPLRFVEPSLVGESYTRFKDEYALVSYKNRFIVVGYRNVSEVKEILACCGVIMTKAEWLKHLPPKKFIHKYVQMGDQQRDYYQRLGSNYLLELEGVGVEVEVDNPLTVLCKLNQISNGFIYYKENTEETLNELYGTESRARRKADRKTYFFKEQPKAKALLDLISSKEFNSRTSEATGDVQPATDVGSGLRGDGHERQPLSDRGDRNDLDSTSGINKGSILRVTSTGVPGLCGDEDRRPDSATGSPGYQPDSLGLLGNRNKCSIEPNIQRDTRAIIWFNLEAELRIISESLGGAGIPFLTISGGCKNVGEIVKRFNTDPSIRFLLCQAKTINYGVTILGTKEEDLSEEIMPQFDPQVSDEIFYSLNFSLEVFLQQQDRIHRIGQTRECRYWILLTNSKVERGIAQRLEEKLICNKEILVDIMRTLDKDLLEA